MKKELQEKLIKKYPHFFDWIKEYKGPIHPIQFGFEIEDGWYWLLENLFEYLTNYQESNFEDNEKIKITQIKEKYGTLRVYYDGGNEVTDGMVWFAEHLSSKLCERCGSNHNIIRTEGWIKYLCKSCLTYEEGS